MKNSMKPIPPTTDEEEESIQAKIAGDADAPEATDEELAQAMSFTDAFPQFAEAVRRARGRPRMEMPKEQISLRLDADVIAAYRDSGKGWQGRVNEILRKAAKL